MNILIVDDEIELLDALQQAIASEGHTVRTASNGSDAHELAIAHSYDLLVLDWMLPGLSGIELCRMLRDRGDTTPVLFLTAKDTLDDRVAGLDAGADDYLVKPFELRELLARIRALLRRSPSRAIADEREEEGVRRDPNFAIELDRRERLAYRNQRAIELSEKETDLLAYFLDNYGKTLTHQQIHTALWGAEDPPSSNVLAALVRLLRRKIAVGNETQLVHTVYGKGYRFGTKGNAP